MRPALNVSLDLVYNRCGLDKLADEVRNAEVAALSSRVGGPLNRGVGDALDLVLDVRERFGVRRLGLDFRTGWSFPDDAYIRDDGAPGPAMLREPDRVCSLIAKFWW